MSGFQKLMAFAFLALLCTIVAADAYWMEPPRSYLNAIYKNYLGAGSKGVPLSEPERVRRYFDKPLAGAIIKDMEEATKRGEPPLLNGDPFVDAQDWEIANLSITARETARDRTGRPTMAVAQVSFTNFKKRQTMMIYLRAGFGIWVITDISGPSGSLRQLYKLK